MIEKACNAMNRMSVEVRDVNSGSKDSEEMRSTAEKIETALEDA